MKTMPILIAMLLAGSAFGGGFDNVPLPTNNSLQASIEKIKRGDFSEVEAHVASIPVRPRPVSSSTDWPDSVRPSFDIRKCDTTPGAVIPPSSASSLINKPADPNLEWAASPAKVDYSIVTLPSGETASVLTFK